MQHERIDPMGSKLGFFLIALSWTAALAAASAGDHYNVSRVTPDGADVPTGQQIVIEFDRPIVALSGMARDAEQIPITITPRLACEWRWLNRNALACQLNADARLTDATRYRIRIEPGIVAANGATLESSHSHTFITARPRVTYSRFVNWLAPGSPLLRVTFNQPVTRESVEQALRIDTSGGPVSIAAFPPTLHREQPYWAWVGDPADDRRDDADEAHRIWHIEPRAALPLNASVALIVQPGLRAVTGPLPGIEQRTVVAFDTYPEFDFVGIRCTPKGHRDPIDIPLAQLSGSLTTPSTSAGCAPLKPAALLFTAPVLNSSIEHHVRFSPDLAAGRVDYDPWANRHDWTSLHSPHRAGHHYAYPLPTQLRAFQRYTVDIDPTKFTDEFGRHLPAPVSFAFHTSHREPALRLAHQHAVLEQDIASDVPLYVTNLDRVSMRFERVTQARSEAGLQTSMAVPAATDVAYALPMRLRELLNGRSGVIRARLRPQPEPPGWHYDRTLTAQVTPFQVHYKLGHFNALAWVTTFASGTPVADARVSLHVGEFGALHALNPLDIAGITNTQGLALLPGLDQVDPELALIWGQDNRRLFVRIDKGDDMALLPVDYAYARTRRRGIPTTATPRWTHPCVGSLRARCLQTRRHGGLQTLCPRSEQPPLGRARRARLCVTRYRPARQDRARTEQRRAECVWRARR